MYTCKKCGTQFEEDGNFCPSCGTPKGAEPAQAPVEEKKDFAAKVTELNNTADTTAAYDQADIANNKAMAILAYFGPLVLIPILAAKESKFARFHSNQGLVLMLAAIAYSIATSIAGIILSAIRLGFVSSILSILSIAFTVLAVIGIINAANGRAKELPIIGKFTILK